MDHSQTTLVDPHWAELGALVTRAEANRAAMSRLQAERAELCAEALVLVDQRTAQRQAAGVGQGERIGDTIPLREVIAELATALRVSEQTVQRWLGDGAALVRHYPDTLDALHEGRIDDRQASAIIDAGMPITDETVRGEYERLVLAIAEDETAPKLRHHAEVIAARLQPEILENQQKSAHERRRAGLRQLEPGLVRMYIDVPAALGHAGMDRLTEMAHALDDEDTDSAPDACTDGDPDAESKSQPACVSSPAATAAASTAAAGAGAAAGRAADPRTLDQRRADIALDLLLSGGPTAHGDGDALATIRGTVHVTVPVLTLAGAGDEPALLTGHGPIDAGTARRIAAGAPGWDRILIHPHTGEPLAVDRYRPSTQLRRYLDARDQHCRWPGCRRRADRCDADHTIAHANGGKTSPANLALLCRRHHVLKHASAWHIRQLGRGRIEFTSPTGRIYRNDAPPVVQFRPRPDLWDPDPGDPPPF